MKKSIIVGREAPILREKAKAVPLEEIKSARIQEVIRKMREAMHAEEDGVAIAAPQIGESLCIFVVHGAALAFASRRRPTEGEVELEDQIFINPEITKMSEKKRKMEEGCLSIRWLYGEVKRSERVRIKAYDKEGKPFERGASGLMAQIFQHEVDHLNGILFIDKAENVQDMPPEAVVEKLPLDQDE